jgi:phage-related protein
MEEKRSRKKIKTGVREGAGRPPGYKWSVLILDQAFEEARNFLNDPQRSHMAMTVKELARQDDPTHSVTVDVRPVEDFHEIRDKGGILGNINVRVFYFVSKANRSIVILGAINKKNDGKTPEGDKIRMRRRIRTYLESTEQGS